MTRIRTEFRCPKCGGSRWGTSGCTGPKKDMRGHCHGGLGGVGCGFTWPRTEDWRCFVITIQKPRRDEWKEYETERLREANRDLRRQAKAVARAKHRRERLKQEGSCQECGAEAVRGRTRCTPCGRRNSARTAASVSERRQSASRRGSMSTSATRSSGSRTAAGADNRSDA